MPRFSFMLHSPKLEPVEGSTTAYKIPSVEVEAPTVEEAWRIAEPKIPEGHRLFCWVELDSQHQID